MGHRRKSRLGKTEDESREHLEFYVPIGHPSGGAQYAAGFVGLEFGVVWVKMIWMWKHQHSSHGYGKGYSGKGLERLEET